MSIFKTIRWHYRNTASSMLVVLLLGACALADFLARAKMDSANGKFAGMDGQTLRQMRLVDFTHAHLWIVFAYVAVFLVFLGWLEIRTAPRWSVWATFTALAMPVLAYGSACLHVAIKVIPFATKAL